MSGEGCKGHQCGGGRGGRITRANDMGGDTGRLRDGGLKLPSPSAIGVDGRGWCFAAAARDKGCLATSLFYQPKDVINSNSLPFLHQSAYHSMTMQVMYGGSSLSKEGWEGGELGRGYQICGKRGRRSGWKEERWEGSRRSAGGKGWICDYKRGGKEDGWGVGP